MRGLAQFSDEANNMIAQLEASEENETAGEADADKFAYLGADSITIRWAREANGVYSRSPGERGKEDCAGSVVVR